MLLLAASYGYHVSPRMSAPPATDAVTQLCEWVEAQGGSAAKVVAGPTPYGLGLHATTNLQRGDVAVSVPSSCLLAAPADDEQALGRLHDSVPDDFWAARLGLLLLAERAKGESSRVAEYLRTLPATYTVPLMWSPEAVKLLQYPTAQRRLVKSAKFVSTFSTERLLDSADAMEAFGGLTVGADALGWAVAASSSRAFALGGRDRVLCPVIDIGNHAPKGEASCELRGTRGGAVELVATRDLAAGDEVSYCYGARLSNDDFLLDYGFVPASNAHDDVQLAWAAGGLLASACDVAGIEGQGRAHGGASADGLADWQRAALRAALPAIESVRIRRSGVDDDAMSACRIAVASDATALRKCDGGRRALPPAGEAKALRVASAMVAIALSGFPEPTEEEEQQQGQEEEESSASGAAPLADGGVALARQFMAGKRAVCTSSLSALADRIKAVQSGRARAEVRGGAAAKQGAGVRKRSAKRGGAAKKAAAGFG